MSKCKPPYNNANIKAPRLQFAIDSGVDKAMKMEQLLSDENIEHVWDKSNAAKTQRENTRHTYDKVIATYFPQLEGNDILDFSAGKGVSTREHGLSSYEPYAVDWTPDYSKSSDIPSNKYKAAIMNAVLNVIPNHGVFKGDRDDAVRELGRVLAPGGVAFIAVRDKKAVAKNKKHPSLNKEHAKDNLDGFFSTDKTFQKGFNKLELITYLKKILGPGFHIEAKVRTYLNPTTGKKQKIGDVAVVVTKIS